MGMRYDAESALAGARISRRAAAARIGARSRSKDRRLTSVVGISQSIRRLGHLMIRRMHHPGLMERADFGRLGAARKYALDRNRTIRACLVAGERIDAL